ncbi:MAG TPA: PfkB family carbohydrate kinase [Mycobacteriales bacterium]|nr:PfkB family carbohydrate kinase [Mycobacteriales bacterium]
MRVVVVGSVNLDLVARVARLPAGGDTVAATEYARVPGGKGANQALAARRLGADVTLLAAVGSDDAADEALALLAEDGVDLTAVRRVDGPTGVALITVDDSGENTIVVVPGANARLTVDPAQLAAADAVICQLEVPMDTVAAAAAGMPAGALFCLNPAPAAPVPPAVLDRADLVVANRAEFASVPGLDRAKLVAVTAGAAGAVLRAGGREVARAESPAVTAADGTGAGDAFTGALVVGLLSGLDREAALRRACRAGAAAASRPGAQPSLPRPADLDALEAE